MPLQRTSKSTQSTTRYRIPKIQKKSKRVSWDPTNILDQARALNLLPAKTSPADVAFAEAMVQLRHEFANRVYKPKGEATATHPMPTGIQKKRTKTASPKRLSPTATFLLTKAVPGYSTLMSISCFSNEIACATEEDYEDYDVLRKMITVTTYADGENTGKFSCAKLWCLIDAEDHRELVRTLGVLAKYDIPLNCALKQVDYPDYDDLSDAIEDEMKTFVKAT